MFSLPRPAYTLAACGILTGVQILQPSLLPRSMSSVSARALPRKCVSHAVDDFKAYPYLFNLKQNATLTVLHPKAGSSSALPGQRGKSNILTAHSSTSKGSPFAFGRRFPLPENWSSGQAISFWYFGRHTGKHITVTLLGRQAADPGPSGWQLAWSDEFNGPAGTPPDPSIWNHEIGDGSGNGVAGWGNQELEYYTKSTDNAALDGDGNLVITARKVAPGQGLSCYYGPCKYTSARLTTQNKMELAYGRVEARIRLPAGAGVWPAFWMLGTDIAKVGWPQSGEIDIMENVGRLPRRLFGTIHGPGYEGAGIGGTYDASDALSNAYHTYAIEWQPGQVSWLVDGHTYFTATKKDAAPNQWVFDHPFFLLLNLAVGGNFAGPVADSTTFPQSMAIDYVRVYQAPDTAERFDASFADSFSGWRRVNLPFTSFKRSRQQPSAAPTGGLSLNSIRGYSFEVPSGVHQSVLLAQVELTSRTGSCHHVE